MFNHLRSMCNFSYFQNYYTCFKFFLFHLFFSFVAASGLVVVILFHFLCIFQVSFRFYALALSLLSHHMTLFSCWFSITIYLFLSLTAAAAAVFFSFVRFVRWLKLKKKHVALPNDFTCFDSLIRLWIGISLFFSVNFCVLSSAFHWCWFMIRTIWQCFV